jgi:hypothetical protein
MINFDGAEKKLRHAALFLHHLEHASREIARELANPAHQGHAIDTLEAYFGACLYNAKSALIILQKTGHATYKKALANMSEAERSELNWLWNLRNQDAYGQTTGAEPLPKYIPEQDVRSGPSYYYGTFVHHNVALFGAAPTIEHENPDGKKVSDTVLRGTTGLYIKRKGRVTEATTVCRRYIDLLTSLIQKMKAAESQEKTR